MRTRRRTAALVIPLAGAMITAPTLAVADDEAATTSSGTGNMIFIHPDGSDAAMWEVPACPSAW